MKSTLLAISLLFCLSKTYSQINNEHLKIGEAAPRIVGIDQFNNTIDSDKILKNNKILLLFYRGNWCPYCKKHLTKLEENLQKFTDKGVRVIVVTPEKVEKVKETTKKWNASYSILHDVNNGIMKNYKVAFDVNEATVPKYFSFTVNKIREYNETENNVLPVPATYIINNDGKIGFVHYDPDYKKRADFNELLSLM